MSTSFKLSNAVIFQIGWFICILTDNVISVTFTVIYLAVYLFYISALKQTSLLKEISWIGIVVAIGFICEAAFFSLGILSTIPIISADSLPANHFTFLYPPIWLLCLWALFATALRSSLAFLFSNPIVGYPLILIAAPLSYYAGAKLHLEIELGHPQIISLVIIGLTWVFAFTLLRKLQQYHFGDATYV